MPRASCRFPTTRSRPAIRAYWTDTHNLAEGAGAAALAAALQEKTKLSGKRVGLVLSGGNIDFDLFKQWVVA
ncbi:threonine dehydratase [Bradyrhizobium japonicum]